MLSRIRFLTPVLFGTVLLGIGCAQSTTNGSASTATAGTSATPTKSALFINVTSGKDNLHGVSMALSLANAALLQGHEVLIFLNVRAPIFATKTLGDDVKFGDFPPVSQMMRDILAKGGKVIVCAHCAGIVNVAENTLLPGTRLSHGGELLAAIKPGMVAFSY